MKDLPPGYKAEGKPTQISGDDCMGNPYSHWRQVAITPHVTNPLIMACGGSPEETQEKLAKQCWEDHNFRSLPDDERLSAMIAAAKKQGRFYDKDLVDVIEMLARRLGNKN